MGLFTRRVETIAPEKAKLAAHVLGLELEGLTTEDVRTAFRNFVKTAHPDVGGGNAEAAVLITNAANARNLLVAWIDSLPADECSCKGTGFVRTGGAFGTVKPCPRCES